MPPYSHIIFKVLQEILPAQSSSVFLPYKISPSSFIPRNIRRIPAPHPHLHSMLCLFRSRSPPLPVCPDKALSHMKENCIIRAACNAPRHFPYHCISLFSISVFIKHPVKAIDSFHISRFILQPAFKVFICFLYSAFPKNRFANTAPQAAVIPASPFPIEYFQHLLTKHNSFFTFPYIFQLHFIALRPIINRVYIIQFHYQIINVICFRNLF